jgi:hypothetical protein
MSITEEVIAHFKQAIGSGDGKHPEVVLGSIAKEVWNAVELKEEKLFDDSPRWHNQYEFIYYIPSEDRWVMVDAGIGKTEYQEHEIWDAYEVRPQEKVITTIEYIKV